MLSEAVEVKPDISLWDSGRSAVEHFHDEPINQKLNRLFDAWAKRHDQDEFFVRDGIIDESLWTMLEKSAGGFKKVVFLLKDKNRNGKVRDREDMVRQRDMRINCRLGAWPVVGQWAYLLQRSSLRPLPAHKEAQSGYALACRSAAIMNLKKTAGIEKADPEAVLGHALRDAKYLHKQLDIIAPDIIICGGVYDVAQKIFPELKMLHLAKGGSGRDDKGRLWISFWHPGYCQYVRGGPAELYKRLVSTLHAGSKSTGRDGLENKVVKYVLITHAVKDYPAWKKIFDEAAAMRKTAGERSYQVLKHEDDPNKIVHFSQWESLAKAKAFFESSKLVEIRRQAGVKAPVFMYLDELEKSVL